MRGVILRNPQSTNITVVPLGGTTITKLEERNNGNDHRP